MTKQKAIREAWDKTGEEYDILEIDGNGWRRDENVKYDTWNGKFNLMREGWHRPKELDGIENNNGWIKIVNESNLPKETGYYDFQKFPQENYIINASYRYKDNKKVGWWVETYTHYQPIEKPKQPIY